MLRDDADLAPRVLGAVREALGCPDLGLAGPVEVLKADGENAILGFRLRGGPDGADRPLILRRFPPERDVAGVDFEATVHEGLRAQGFPAPRVLVACRDDALLGGAFLLIERVPGRMLLGEIGELDDVLASPTRAARVLPRMVWESCVRVPRALASTMLRLHRVDAEPILSTLAARGFDPDAFTAAGRLAAFERRAQEAKLEGLLPTLAWLRRRLPPSPRRVVCHGDFQFLNVLVEGSSTSGVVDWSFQHCTFEAPSFDVGNTSALLGLRLPGLPALAHAALAPIQQIMGRRFRALYERELELELDPDHVRSAEVFRYAREMVAAGELLAAGRRASGTYLREQEPPWIIPELRSWVLGALEARTGLPASLARPA